MTDRPEHDNGDDPQIFSPSIVTADGPETAMKGDWQGYDLSILNAVLDG